RGGGEGGAAPSLHAPMAVAVVLDTLIERGAIEEAERVLTESGLADAASPLLLFTFLIGTRARLRAAQGQTSEAIAELLALGERTEGVLVTPALVPWR